MSGLNVNQHPCFNVGAKGKFGRVHLPVAPECNIRCNYCNRKYDCVNESRPGVTSSVLKPDQAVVYMGKVLEKMPNISVAGIAGPGDAFANPEVTLESLRLIRKNFPDLILCLASNGLNLTPYVQELADLQVSHVTVTINAVDPEIGAKIYSWVRNGKVILRGLRAATLLLERQLEAVKALKEAGIIVKINTIVIPGVNDHHVLEVAKKMAELGVDMQNCMTMFPTAGAPFENIPEPTKEQMATIRSDAEKIIPQMKHCTRCRADAVGLLGDDKSAEFRGCLSDCSKVDLFNGSRPNVAVATLEGLLVNQHLGEAYKFQIWGQEGDGYSLIEERRAPEPGTGLRRWLELAESLKDCRAILVSGLGDSPKHVLAEHNIIPIEMEGLIKMGLDAVYKTGNITALKARRGGGCSKGVACSGSGEGCG
jgi:nitrogen fixation protein NifB